MSSSFATLWTIACQAPLSMGFPRQEYWSGLPFPSPGNLPDPRIEPTSPDWHHWLNGYEFEHTPGYSEGQERRACCSLWGCKELDMTSRLNNSLPQSPQGILYHRATGKASYLVIIPHWDHTCSASDYLLILAGIVMHLLSCPWKMVLCAKETLSLPGYAHLYSYMFKQYQDSLAFH